MNDRTFTRKEEARFLKAAQRVLLLQGGFPNPTAQLVPQSGFESACFRQVSPEKVMDCIEHIGMCSPCYKEYDELRRQIVRRRRILLGAIAACIFTGLSFAIWTTASLLNPADILGPIWVVWKIARSRVFPVAFGQHPCRGYLAVAPRPQTPIRKMPPD